MKTSLVLCSAVIGVTTLWAAPAIAQDAPVVVEAPAPTPPVVVVQPAPAPASSTLVVNGPSGRSTEGSPRLYPGLIWGGVALWAVAYTPAVIGAAVGNDACEANTRFCLSGRQILYVPIAGPFIAIAGVNGGVGSSTLKTLLALDGAFQAGGVAMMLTGIILSAQSRPSHAVATSTRRTSEHKVLFSPFATATSAGVGAVGRF